MTNLLTKKRNADMYLKLLGNWTIREIAEFAGISERAVQFNICKHVREVLGENLTISQVRAGSFPCPSCKDRKCQTIKRTVWMCPLLESWAKKVIDKRMNAIFSDKLVTRESNKKQFNQFFSKETELE